MNLVTNARDAMPNGGTVRIETSLREVDGGSEPASARAHAVLSVRDSGVGMDRATRERIFEPFFTTKDVGKGTGLGLATVYGAVDQSGGHIEVSSAPGQGSCFRVFLPLAQSPGSTGAEGGSSARRPSGLRGVVRPRAPANILLVEDEPAVRTITQRMLVASGYRVLVAANATEASALFAGSFSPIDLLITDVVMPGLDGPALAAQLRAARPQLPVLFISGYRHEHVIPSDPAGTSAFLAKPFARDVFLAKVIELLAAARKAEAHPALRA
jgi:CheY-like chemotaxis protein